MCVSTTYYEVPNKAGKFTHNQLLTIALEDHLLATSTALSLAQKFIFLLNECGIDLDDHPEYSEEFNKFANYFEEMQRKAPYEIEYTEDKLS